MGRQIKGRWRKERMMTVGVTGEGKQEYRERGNKCKEKKGQTEDSKFK